MIAKSASEITSQDLEQLRSEISKWHRYDFSPEEVDEIVSETLTAYSTVLFRGDSIQKTTHWLLRSASKIAHGFRCKRAEESRRFQEYLGDELSLVLNRRDREDTERDPRGEKLDRDKAQESEIDVAVTKALEAFSESQRDILRLRIVCEYKMNEAAALVGACRSTAKSWITRAIKGLSEDPVLRQIMNS